MTLPEIPPAHREAMTLSMYRSLYAAASEGHNGLPLDECGDLADAAIATLLRLGYRVAPGWVAESSNAESRLRFLRDEMIALNHQQMVFGEHQPHGRCGYCKALQVIEMIGQLIPMLPAPPTTPHHTATDKGE